MRYILGFRVEILGGLRGHYGGSIGILEKKMAATT